MQLIPKRVILLIASIVLTFVCFRVYLVIFPHTNLDIGAYNIHHLFTGLILITLGALPLIIFRGDNRWCDVATLTFGAGLSMALDQWVYLIVTDGSDLAYLSPISLSGAIAAIGITLTYLLLLVMLKR